MTTETNITGTWTASQTGWHEFTLWGSGAGGVADGGGGGSSGCRVTAKVLVTAGQQFTITRGAVGLGGQNGNYSQVERSGVIAKAMGGITAAGAVGGTSVTTGCIGDVITAGGPGSAYNAGTDTGGNGGSAPGGGAGGVGLAGDDGGTGTAPGGGGAGGASGGCLAGNGALGRVNVEYPVTAPATGPFLGLGTGSLLGTEA